MMFDRGYNICMVAVDIGYPHVRDAYLFFVKSFRVNVIDISVFCLR